jgi:hypothetical protein
MAITGISHRENRPRVSVRPTASLIGIVNVYLLPSYVTGITANPSVTGVGLGATGFRAADSCV